MTRAFFLLSCGAKMSTSGFGMPAENLAAGHDNDKRVAEFLHPLRYYSVRLTSPLIAVVFVTFPKHLTISLFSPRVQGPTKWRSLRRYGD
jgi:hypothetical protein